MGPSSSGAALGTSAPGSVETSSAPTAAHALAPSASAATKAQRRRFMPHIVPPSREAFLRGMRLSGRLAGLALLGALLLAPCAAGADELVVGALLTVVFAWRYWF